MVVKKVAILQPNYIPWKGYFDMIRSVDEFIFLDDVQYTHRDWRNRNLIKTATGLKWLTIPVTSKSRADLISEVTIADGDWKKKHWDGLVKNYARARCFDTYRDRFEKLYHENEDQFISQLDMRFIREINDILGINTPLSCSSDYSIPGAKTDKLLGICRAAGAGHYISGPAAQAYLDESLFRESGISVEWFDYTGYPEYNQVFPPFQHGVTVLDLIFNEGTSAISFMKRLKDK